MLSLRSVTKRYGEITALDEVSLEVGRGEFFGLLGPNGAGKSTLMSLVAGLRTPDAGTIVINDTPLSSNDCASRSELGLIPQHIALYPRLSAERNLRIFGGLQGLRGQLLSSRIDEALNAVQLHERRRDRVETFSGGMQRRLNLAAGILHRPKILLCDEPTVGIDPQSRNAIFDFLTQLNRDGLTIIYSTHYMEEATRLCSRIGVIDHGKLLALGTLDELLTRLPFDEEIRFPAAAATATLATQLEKYGQISVAEQSHCFRPRSDFPMSAFYGLAESHHLPSRLFVTQRPNLEALFLHLTGRTLRE